MKNLIFFNMKILKPKNNAKTTSVDSRVIPFKKLFSFFANFFKLTSFDLADLYDVKI